MLPLLQRYWSLFGDHGLFIESCRGLIHARTTTKARPRTETRRNKLLDAEAHAYDKKTLNAAVCVAVISLPAFATFSPRYVRSNENCARVIILRVRIAWNSWMRRALAPKGGGAVLSWA